MTSLFLRWPLLSLLLAAVFCPQPARGAMEYRFIYFPDRLLVSTPERFGLPFEDIRFAAADGENLHGWYLPAEDDKPLILFFHGNAGNISHRLDNLRHFHRLGLPVFIFDYRGYGQSGGKASEEGTYDDARGALAYLRQRGFSPDRILYFGRSLGAGVAVQLALEAPPAGLVLESPFPSMATMGWHHNPLLYLLLGWLLEPSYDSLAKIGDLHVPLLLFQGSRDRIVPEKMARRLFERARHPKRFHLIEGAGHNDTYEVGGEAYWKAWRRFLDELAAEGANRYTD